MGKKKLTLSLREEQFGQLVSCAAEQQLSVDEYVIKILFPDEFNESQTLGYYCKKIVHELERIAIGDQFTVVDLLGGVAWRQLPNGMGTKIGRWFRRAIADGKFPGIVFSHKGYDQYAVYRRE